MPSDVVLLTGASGLLGTWLRRAAPPGHAVVAVAHRRSLADVPTVRVDLRDAAAVMAAVERLQPSMIIHAAYAKDHTSIVGATENVANAAANVGASTVLVSTDAVFSGDGMPRGEDAVPDPIWDYGRWKASAEEIVSTHTHDGTTLRLPLIVSVDPDDHVVQRIRSAAARGETTDWFSDETRQPASAAELAAAIWRSSRSIRLAEWGCGTYPDASASAVRRSLVGSSPDLACTMMQSARSAPLSILNVPGIFICATTAPGRQSDGRQLQSSSDLLHSVSCRAWRLVADRRVLGDIGGAVGDVDLGHMARVSSTGTSRTCGARSSERLGAGNPKLVMPRSRS